MSNEQNDQAIDSGSGAWAGRFFLAGLGFGVAAVALMLIGAGPFLAFIILPCLLLAVFSLIISGILAILRVISK